MVSRGHHGVPDALLRTLIANLLRQPDEYAPDTKHLEEMYSAWEKYLECKRDHPDDLTTSFNKQEVQLRRKYLLTADSVRTGCVFFVTHNGRIGLGPRNLTAGDMICVFKTYNVPLILRAHLQQEDFELVGEANVHGIMHGEALELEQQGMV